MPEFHLPVETHISQVHLQVANLERAMEFYHKLLGFRSITRGSNSIDLSPSGKPPMMLRLTEHAGAVPKPAHTTGLYHVALRFPSRGALGQAFMHLVQHRYTVNGLADHNVSEAIYLADPDGNGVELYCDRPKEDWVYQDGQLVMSTQPLNLNQILEETAQFNTWAGLTPAAGIGHIHIQVDNLDKAEAFYSGLIGLDVTQRSYPGALFLSAGGYHHHLGVNVWAGVNAPPPPPEAAGLLSFTVLIPDHTAWEVVQQRLREAEHSLTVLAGEDGKDAFQVSDPSGNQVIISCPV